VDRNERQNIEGNAYGIRVEKRGAFGDERVRSQKIHIHTVKGKSLAGLCEELSKYTGPTSETKLTN
jgi:hypothetical protein